MKTLGRILAVWVLAASVLLPMAGGYATYAGLPSLGAMMQSMHSAGGSQN